MKLIKQINSLPLPWGNEEGPASTRTRKHAPYWHPKGMEQYILVSRKQAASILAEARVYGNMYKTATVYGSRIYTITSERQIIGFLYMSKVA
jgi:hypothetical protein